MAARPGVWPRASRSSRSAQGAASGSPGFFDRATDPWVSFSADGQIAYSISDSFNANGPAFGGASSIIISRSTDGGEPLADARDGAGSTPRPQVLNDKESVTGDPLAGQHRLRGLGPARLPERERQPRRLRLTPSRSAARRCSRRRPTGRDLEPGRVDLRPGPEEPDDRQPDRRADRRARRRAS